MIPEVLKAPLRALRHLPDRLMHTSRRRRALEHVARLDVRSAVFICHGNINRSAYAAAVFARSVPPNLRDGVTVRSAGFVGPDRPASDLARTVASRRGLDLSAHRSRRLDAAELTATDLIVVMNTRQCGDICALTARPRHEVVILGDLDPDTIVSRSVQDPYGHPVHVFERVFDRIDRCMDQLTKTLWKA